MPRPISLRLDETLLAAIDAKASAAGITRTEWIARALSAAVGDCDTPVIPRDTAGLDDAIAAAVAPLVERIEALEKFDGAIAA